MNQPNPYEFQFSAEATSAVRTPVQNYLFKVLRPSFLACLLFVLMGPFLLRMFPVLRHAAQLYFFAVVVFVPFFQTSRCLRLPSQGIPSVNRAFIFGIGAIVAFVGVLIVRAMLFQGKYLDPNVFMAVTTTALLVLFRRIVFGEMKMFRLIVAILPTNLFALLILVKGTLLLRLEFPVLYRFGLTLEGVALCLYAHIVCASWWLSDKMAPPVP